MKDYILEANHIDFSYPDGTKALYQLSLGLSKGKKIAIVGSNGAGKSTLFLHFNGIHKPSSGEIKFNGDPIQYKKKYLNHLREKVGIVFQEPDNQLFASSIVDEIAFGPINFGYGKEKALEMATNMIKKMELSHLSNRPTYSLSFGQKKQVAIASIVVCRPKVIILDEPTAGLDPYYKNKMLKILNHLHAEGMTVIISTHDVNTVFQWAEEVHVLKNGSCLYSGSPSQVFSNEDLLIKTGLEKPFILEAWEAISSPSQPPSNMEQFKAYLKNLVN